MLDWGGDGGGDCGGDCGGDFGGECGTGDMQMTIFDVNYPVKTYYSVSDPPTGNTHVQVFDTLEGGLLNQFNSHFYDLNTPNYLMAGMQDRNKTSKFQRKTSSGWSCLELFLLVLVLCMMLLTVIWIIRTILAVRT